MRMIRKCLGILLILVIITSYIVSPIKLKAATISYSGNLSALGASGITWSIDSAGLLTVNGSGTINTTKPTFPWLSNKSSIKSAIINISSINTTYNFFKGCSSLTNINFTNFNTSSITDMSGMFTLCSGLKSLDLSNFYTTYVTDMADMFSYCSGLTSLNLSNFDTRHVTSMYCMFEGCTRLTSLNVSNFNTISVTNMSGMFNSCCVLTSLNLSSFNTSNVTSMGNTSQSTEMGMFGYCYGLTSLDLSNFNTNKVTDMSGLFSYCYGLTFVNLSSFNTGNATYINDMFYGCDNITIDSTDIKICNYDFTGQTIYFSIKYVMDKGANNVNNVSKYKLGSGLSLSEPSRIGYKFLGWYLSSNSGFTINISNISTTDRGTKTVYAKWEVIPLSGVHLTCDSLVLDVGDTYTLSAIAEPDNAFFTSTTWSSSNIDVVKVSRGQVTVVGSGRATITVTIDDYSATCVVYVPSFSVIIPSQCTINQSYNIASTVSNNGGISSLVKKTLTIDISEKSNLIRTGDVGTSIGFDIKTSNDNVTFNTTTTSILSTQTNTNRYIKFVPTSTITKAGEYTANITFVVGFHY